MLKAIILAGSLLLSHSVAAQTADVPVKIMVDWTSPTPLISPSGSGAAYAGTFNPAAVRVGNKTVLLYREQDKSGTSRIGYASSTDGVHFKLRSRPVLQPETDYEKLFEGIKRLGAWYHCLDSTWLVSSSRTAAEIRDYLLPFIHTNDSLLVTRVTSAAWHNLPNNGSAWIKDQFARAA